MYYPILLRAGLIALTLGSIQVQADERYPAADFEPKVLYRAQEEVSSDIGATGLGAEYPAAHFTPQVVFQDPELIETVGPLTQAAPPAQAQAQPVAAAPAKQSRPVAAALEKKPRLGQTGPISDATPPYGALGLAVVVIALSFWWSARQAKLKAELPEAPRPQHAPATEAISQGLEASEGGEEALEELAAEVEQTLATTNRQRANKTKRTRRR